MDRAEEIIEEKNELEERIDELRQEYLSIVPPCGNKNCTFYNEKVHTNHCSWTWWITECGDYEPDEEIQE